MTPAVAAPTFEHHREALGIGAAAPRLSWKTTAGAGWTQAAYELRVQRGDQVWESGTPVASDESVLVPWPVAPLASRERAEVSVRVTGADGSRSEWSEPAAVEAGLLAASDWVALAVGAAWEEDPESDERRPPLLRREFSARGNLVAARLYVTAHGLYEVEINGRRVGDDAMSPGWTSYRNRLRYYTYDVTDAVADGENAIGAWLGDGWYRGRMGWNGGFRNLFGHDLSLLAQLELRYADGTIETVATDDSWRAAPSPIVRSGNYDGELYDAREELEGGRGPATTTPPGTGWSPPTAIPRRSSRPRGRPCAAPRRSRRSRCSRRRAVAACSTSARTSSAASASACPGHPAIAW